jgi:CCR4-NOT transcription complex subunit 4
MHVEPEVLEAAVLEKRRKEKVKLAGKPNQPGSAAALNPENLLNVRILQRNLVYVIGLSASVAKEEVLRKKEYFGRFGKILKVAVNRKPTQTSNSQKSSCSAYVTFKREEDALDAIQNINGTVLDGRTVRATFGTTKYCSFFLKNASCSNPNCLYLHELADDKDCFLKDDLNASERSLESSGLVRHNKEMNFLKFFVDFID